MESFYGFYLYNINNSNPLSVILVKSTEKNPQEEALKKALKEILGDEIIQSNIPGDYEKIIVKTVPNIGRPLNSKQPSFVKQYFRVKQATLVI